MNTHADKAQENKSQAVAKSLPKLQSNGESTFQFVDNRPEAVAQRKLQKMANNSPQVSQLRAFQDMVNNSPQVNQAAQLQSMPDNHSALSNGQVIQRLIGAAAPINGHDEILLGDAENRGAAALKIANYINLRAREIIAANPVGGIAAVHSDSSDLGANNAGNLYVRSNYTAGVAAASLETWSEMTGVGGGYVKRVRIIEGGNTVMDRVINDPEPSALNFALIVNAAAGGVGGIGNRQYGADHVIVGGDAYALNILGNDNRTADNITKMVGEGARFGWLAEGLSNGNIGNSTTDIFKVTVKVPQIGRFTMNPTFVQLWGAWRSAFGRKYMKDKREAVKILRERMIEGWARAQQGDIIGDAPLAHEATAAGQVTSLTKNKIVKAVPRPVATSNGAAIVSGLSMTFFSAD